MGGGPDLGPQQQLAGQIQGVGSQLQGIAFNPALKGIASGQMTPEEQAFYAQQRQAIEAGRDPAIQGVRDMATQRGLYSSQGAITQEIGANQQIQGQLADTYGQQAQLSRQGILQGTGLQQNLLQGAAGAYGQALGGQGNIAQQKNQNDQGMMGTVGSVGGAAAGIFCFLGDVKIKMFDGAYKKVSEIQIDDDVFEGGRVLATGVSRVPEEIYDYNGNRVSGGHLVFEDGIWKRVYRSKKAKKLYLSSDKRYPIVTENHLLITEDGQVWADYSETNQGFEVTDKQRVDFLNNDPQMVLRNTYLSRFKIKEVA